MSFELRKVLQKASGGWQLPTPPARHLIGIQPFTSRSSAPAADAVGSASNLACAAVPDRYSAPLGAHIRMHTRQPNHSQTLIPTASTRLPTVFEKPLPTRWPGPPTLMAESAEASAKNSLLFFSGPTGLHGCEELRGIPASILRKSASPP